MNKIIERLLVFCLGMPLIIASVLFFPFWNYFLLHLELLFFCTIGILEMRDLLSKKFPVHSIPAMIVFGLLLPLSALLHTVFSLPGTIVTFAIAIAVLAVLFTEFALSFSGKFENSLGRVAASLFVVMYPGYLMMFLGLMTGWDNAGYFLALFLLMVFGCDSLAWFFGVLFGKGNRGLFPASPNKSIAGFIGGYAGSILSGIGAWFFLPFIFKCNFWLIILIGFMTATASITGDIIESIFKRSAGMKDSGRFIPGRGGVLDSIDSIIFAAPVYYILCNWIFGL